MEKRRRIRITTFRRRTTIILRDKQEGGSMEPPPRHVDASHSVLADSPQAEGDDLNPTGRAASAEPLEIPEGRKGI